MSGKKKPKYRLIEIEGTFLIQKRGIFGGYSTMIIPGSSIGIFGNPAEFDDRETAEKAFGILTGKTSPDEHIKIIMESDQ